MPSKVGSHGTCCFSSKSPSIVTCADVLILCCGFMGLHLLSSWWWCPCPLDIIVKGSTNHEDFSSKLGIRELAVSDELESVFQSPKGTLHHPSCPDDCPVEIEFIMGRCFFLITLHTSGGQWECTISNHTRIYGLASYLHYIFCSTNTCAPTVQVCLCLVY